MSGYLRGAVLPHVRTVAVTSMGDTCIVRIWAEVRDADHQETGEDWTTGTTYVCGFQPVGTREAGTNQVTTQDRLRLPLSAVGVVGSRDRIRMTARDGAALVPAEDYSIDGAPIVGKTAITVNLVRVTNA